MFYSCALIFFLCSSGCLLTIGLFSDRWLLVEVSLKETDKIRVTTYVSVGLWETRRVRYYHYYHHYHPYFHHHHAVLVYPNDHIQHHVQAPPPPPPMPPPRPTQPASSPTVVPVLSAVTSKPKTAGAFGAEIALSGKETSFATAHLTEKTLYHLSDTNSGALIAIRVLLFFCIGLTFGALFLLLVTACNDTNVIRHRYKEKKLAFTLAGLCAVALLLTIISWSVFLGTMYHSVQQYGNGASNSLNAGFVCSVLATVCLVVSIILSACTVDED